ncbi:MAG: signal peptidase I [Synergistaceae bacterium]|nr:signal peptidase I [Synergistaceae bacterium]
MAEAVAKSWKRETIETIIWALVLALILRTFVIQAFWIPSGSMLPTLQIEDRVLVAKFWNWIKEPSRGSIYVFKYPVDPERDFIKRIIGLPGDTINIQNGAVSVNGELIDEPYVKNMDRFTLRQNDIFKTVPAKVPEDMYFALGDNRMNSQDGRYWGFVPKSYLKGPAFFRYWPLNRIGLIDN